MSEREKIAKAADFLRLFAPRPPHTVVVLGSGLGGFAERLGGARVPTRDIPGWPASTVEGHQGVIAFAQSGVATLSGRVHLYEGYSPAEVVFPVRTLIALGARTIILTNASGGLDARFHAGDLVIVSDHLNLTGASPLAGPNEPELGPRFPDLTDAYDHELRATALRAAQKVGLGTLKEGIYAGLAGPAYETPAEVHMLKTLGADLVGMSTVLETIAARHMGARVLAISAVSNLAAGISPKKLTHEEVLEAGRQAAPRLEALLQGVLDETAG
jgi:purine-nucleoside phosphorylase